MKEDDGGNSIETALRSPYFFSPTITPANPPYSVKDFKQHLQLKNNSFTLLDCIGLNGGEIETLFVERIGQLLKPQGIAAVILPSSILSNDSTGYTGAREQFLKNFYIRAIVAFGSKTFGATGTNTVVMFLEKFNEPPKQIDLSSDSADAIFSGTELKDWKDQEILEAYIAQIEIDSDQYSSFLRKKYSLNELGDIEYFKMYVAAYADSADAKNLQKTRAYKSKSADEQTAAYLERLYTYAHGVEREKLFYFSLVYRQTTVIITAPADNKAQKDFLGYDWSNRKGNEGIQIITPGGKLYDNSDREAEGTLAHAIRQSFNGIIPSFIEEQKAWGSVVSTKDMLDFSRTSFNKAIKLGAEKKIQIRTKFPVIFLEKLEGVEIRKGQAIKQEETVEGIYKVIAWGKNYAYTHNKYNRTENVITVSASGANAGCVNFWKEKIWASDCTTIQSHDDILIKWIYYYLESIQNQLIRTLQKGSAQPHVYPRDIGQVPIPKLNREIQSKIVKECEKIDAEYETTRMSIEAYRQKIEELFNELDVISSGGYRLNLADSTKFDISIGKRVLDKQLVPDGTVPVYSANVINPFGYINEFLITDFTVPSVLWGIDGDWMTNYIPADSEFYPTDHCGVLRCKTSEINPRYMAHILETEGNKMGFSRSYRASIDRIQGIAFTVCDRSAQDKVIAKIEVIEKQIREAEKNLEALNGKTTEILNQYLN